MSIYYNWELTNRREKDKSQHDLIELATMMDRRGSSAENAQKGDSLGVSPTSHWDPPLSARVTTGGLSAPISRWKVRCHLLWIDGSRLPDHAPLLGINIEELWGSHNGRKMKGHFPPRQWSLFLCLTFLSQSPVQ
jgi:hypothetical protein